MKIIELNITGFRSLKEVTWKPGDLNLIIGPNGSGKSNLLKALEMISEFARGHLSDQVTCEGGMGSLVWDGRAERIVFNLQVVQSSKPSTPDNKPVLYILEITRLGRSSSYKITKELLDDGIHDSTHPHARIDRTQNSALAYAGDGKGIEVSVNLDEMITDNESIVSKLSSPFVSSISIEVEVQHFFENWQVYQNFQTHPESEVRRSPIARAEKSVSPDGANLIQVLHTLIYKQSRI